MHSLGYRRYVHALRLRWNARLSFLPPSPIVISTGKRHRRTSHRFNCTQSTSSLPKLPLFYSDHYEFPLPPQHRFPMQKYRLTREKLQKHPFLLNSTFSPSPLALPEDLSLVHDDDYIHSFCRLKLSKEQTRRIGFPATNAGVQRALGSTGGTVAAMKCVLRGAKIAGQIAGGTHHAKRHCGGGFCVFNDIAVAASVALREGVEKILVLDFDVHQGDGTAQIFENDNRVLTVSVHGENNYPFRKERSDVDIGLEDGTGNEEYLKVVEYVMQEWGGWGDLVFLQMGVDPLTEDTLGRLSITREGLQKRNATVYDDLLRRKKPAVISMGGGYSNPIDASVRAHADVYIDAVKAMMRAE